MSSKTQLLVVFEELEFNAKTLERLAATVDESAAAVTYFDSTEALRPKFSPERLRGQDYLGAALLLSADAISLVGGFDESLQQFIKLDFVLKATRLHLDITHNELALGREKSPGVILENRAASAELRSVVQNHLDQTPGGGVLETVVTSTLYPSARESDGTPLISIVIPTRGRWLDEKQSQSHVLTAVESIVEKSTYTHYEVVIVVDTGAEPAVIATLQDLLGEKLTLIWWEKPFNFSQKINTGVVGSSGDFVLLLNDDVEVISADWLERMLALAQLPGAGMVGAMLYFEDGTIQHAGHAYYLGSPTHIGLGAPRSSAGPQNSFLIEREVSGVTAACALLPREVFMRVGGMSSLLPGNFNDVDLAMKIGTAGYAIYWTPFAELFHFESQTRDSQVHFSELDILRHRWQPRLDDRRFWPQHPHQSS